MSLLQLLSSNYYWSINGDNSMDSLQISSTNNNTNRTSNPIASEIYLQHLDPYLLSGLSIGIELLFIPIFLGLVTFIAVFMKRKDIRTVMARNQKILLTLVIILLLVQSIGLTFRAVFDCLTIDITHKIQTTIEKEQGMEIATQAMSTMNSTTSAAQAGVTDSQIIALYLMGSFEVMTQVQNISLILFIVLFITNVFLNTVGIAIGIISTRKMTLIRYIVNVLGGSAVVLMLVVITTTAIAYFVIKIRISVDFQTYLYAAVYVIFVVTVLFLGIISNSVGCVVFNVIRRRTSKLNKQANQKSLKKVVILQLGVNISALLQLLAGIFIALSAEQLYLKLLFYFFNNVGIVLFSCLVFSLYHPLFTGAVKELNEMKEKSSQSGGDTSRIDQLREFSEKSSEKRKNTKRQSVSPMPTQQKEMNEIKSCQVELPEEEKNPSSENAKTIQENLSNPIEENRTELCRDYVNMV